MKIALAGNPNSGKTTMYNALTGSSEKVGNWAGVTVDKRESKLKKSYFDGDITIVDLPGAYSMSPFTFEETITSSFILNEKPDVIINIVDATNLSRSLFLTTQLLELDIPMIIALNKADVNRKKHTDINEDVLSKKLGCMVVETVSTSKAGLKSLVEKAVRLKGKKHVAPFKQNDIDKTNRELVEIEDKRRFDFVNQVVSLVEKRESFAKNLSFQDKIDDILISKWFGIPIFAIVMFLVFGISQAWLGPFIADGLVGILEEGQGLVSSLLANENGELGIWSSMLVDGVLGGVIAVISFLPLVMIMYFLIALLEDCGYMARASVVLDPIFKKVGLSGKSIIPFVIGTGCSVPGVMACRTIKNERERKATAMLTPFMPCGAKLPVIALFSGVFFKNSSWIGVMTYFLGIIIILLCSLLIKAITGNKNKKSFFIMELPEYKIPSIKEAFKSMLSRGWAYIVKAGTIILVCNFAIKAMQTFDWTFNVVEADKSILHDLATPFAYLIAPIVGVVAWQLAAAAITGFIAKENIVGTIAVCYGITNFINLDELVLEGGAPEVAQIMAITKIAALAFLAFNLFTPPCFAAIGAMNAEINDRKWFFGGIGLQFVVGYTVGFLIYLIGSLFAGITLTAWMVCLGLAIIVLTWGYIGYLILKNKKTLEKEGLY